MFSTDLSWAEGPTENFGQRRERKARERERSVAGSSSTPSRASSQTRSSITLSSRGKNRKCRTSDGGGGARGASAPGSSAGPMSECESALWSGALAPFGFVSAPTKSIRSFKSHPHRPGTTASTSDRSTAPSTTSPNLSERHGPTSCGDSLTSVSGSASVTGSSSKHHHNLHAHISHFTAGWGSVRLGRAKKSKHQQSDSADSTGRSSPLAGIDFRDPELHPPNLTVEASLSPSLPSGGSIEPTLASDLGSRYQCGLNDVTDTSRESPISFRAGDRRVNPISTFATDTERDLVAKMENRSRLTESPLDATDCVDSIGFTPSCHVAKDQIEHHADPVEICQSYERITQAILSLQLRSLPSPTDSLHFTLSEPSPISSLDSSAAVLLHSSIKNKCSAVSESLQLSSEPRTGRLECLTRQNTEATPARAFNNVEGSTTSSQTKLAQKKEFDVLSPLSPLVILSSFLTSIQVPISSSQLLDQIGQASAAFSSTHGFDLTSDSTLCTGICILMILRMKCIQAFRSNSAQVSLPTEKPSTSFSTSLRSESRASQILEIDGMLAETFWDVVCFQAASVQHLISIGSNCLNPPDTVHAHNPLPSKVTQTSSKSLLPLQFPDGAFQLARCCRVPALLPASSIPAFLSELHRVLDHQGLLELRLVEPMPVRGTVGPKLQAWLEKHLELNLEANFRCQRPGVVVPNWALQSGFTILQNSLEQEDKDERFIKNPSTRTLRLPAVAADDHSIHERYLGPIGLSRISARVLQELWKSTWADMLDFPSEVSCGDEVACVGRTRPGSVAPVSQTISNSFPDGFYADWHHPPCSVPSHLASLPVSPHQERFYSSVAHRQTSSPASVSGVQTATSTFLQNGVMASPLWWWCDEQIVKECREWGTVWDITELWLQKR